MSENEKLQKLLEELSSKLPHFEDGRIDYSTSNFAPVITCFIKFKDEILLLKRSDKVRTYQGKWNTVAGYIDEPVSIFQKAMEELKEELGITEDNIDTIKVGDSFEIFDQSINKIWLTHPVLVELNEKIDVKLDWEHTDFKWIRIDQMDELDTVPSLEQSLKSVVELNV